MFKWIRNCLCGLKNKENSIELEQEVYEMNTFQPEPGLSSSSSNRRTFSRMRPNLAPVCELQEMEMVGEAGQTSRQSEETSCSSTTFSDEGSNIVQPSCSTSNIPYNDIDREMASSSQWNFFAYLEGRPISKKPNNCNRSTFDEQMEEKKKFPVQKGLKRNSQKEQSAVPNLGRR